MTERSSTAVVEDRPVEARPVESRFRPLDGLRGLAVLAVFLYHAGVSWAPGGLFGVDVFFVLSGYLITGLLLAEHERTGAISLRRFWARRIRRLLPAAVLLVIVTVTVWQATADPSEAPSLRRDALATLGYVANWRFAFSGQSYFDHYAPPSPLLHMWSLGVEEQFYVLWPLIVLLILSLARRRGRGRGRGPLALISAVLLVLSAGWCALLAVGGGDPSRLYYGTDTRASALLLGAIAACLVRFASPTSALRAAARTESIREEVTAGHLGVAAAPDRSWPAEPAVPRPSRRARHRRPPVWPATLLGLIGTAGLVAAVGLVDGQSPGLYRGGFVAVAAAAGAVLVSVLRAPRSPLARLLSVPPLTALGRISYGIYLWHWPLVLWLDADRTGLDGPWLFAARAGATLAIAGLSWALLELPVLRGTLRIPWPRIAVPALVAGLAVACVAAPLPRTAGQGATPDLAALERQSATTPPPRAPDSEAAARPPRILLVGDSVALTLGMGVGAVANEKGFVFVDSGLLGCGIITGGPIRDRGNVDGGPPNCDAALDHWLSETRRVQPDIVAVQVGRWETYDRYYQGAFRAPGDPVFDQHLSDLLRRHVDALLAEQVRVALLTPVCTEVHETADGTPTTEDDPARRIRFAQLLADEAARHPDGSVRLYDVNAQLCPTGTYQRTAEDGRVLRTSDGIHIAGDGGIQIGHWLLPQLQAFANEGQAG